VADVPRDDDIAIRQATAADAGLVADVLREVSDWLAGQGDIMWDVGELDPERIAEETAAGQFFVAERGGDAAGVIRFQLDDQLFWPDLTDAHSAFVHRLAVRRRFAGTGVSVALLAWSVDHARRLGRQWLRLDCDHQRARLRAVYERFGFRLHSYRQVGPYYVARYEYPLGLAAGAPPTAGGR
jgi:GNAT superfamily N-acetyltransferase